MSWEMWLSLLFLLLATFDISTGNDFDDGNCKEYKAIPEDDYDIAASSAVDLSKRPLGFMSTTIKFVTNDPNAKNPCFKLTLNNSSKQTVEVLATSAVGSTRFCVKSEPLYAQATCQSGIKTCADSALGYDSIKYVFYCEGCETDLPIWFRFTVSPPYTDGLDFEAFCQRDIRYPNSLIILPVGQDITTTPTSKACPISLTFIWFFSIVSFVFLNFLIHPL